MKQWDYTAFGNAGEPDAQAEPTERVPLVFEKKFAGHHWVDKWTINGKSFPKTDPIRVKANGRYRLVFDNRSDEAHPVHLHRHTFELVKIAGAPTSGVHKDVVVVAAKSQTEVDLIANNPGSDAVPLPSADAHGLRIHDADGICLTATWIDHGGVADRKTG